jgi:hypothetical protein
MSYVYFVQVGDDGPIKIGTAMRPQKRLMGLQGANPKKLHLRAFIQGGRREERVLHDRFADGRIRGEWFRADTPGLAEVIERAAAGNRPRWKSQVPAVEAA